MSTLVRPDVIPIPIRKDTTVFVHLPLDLTVSEARKVAAVVLAYAGVSPFWGRNRALPPAVIGRFAKAARERNCLNPAVVGVA